MYNDYYYTEPTSMNADTTWIIISVVLALVGGIVAYFLFVKNKNGKYTGFLAWLHDFLNFKKYYLEAIIKILYMISVIAITLGSFSLIRTSVASFFLVLILGNIIARISFEFCLMLLTVVKNTTEINKKLSMESKKESTKNIKKSQNEKE